MEKVRRVLKLTTGELVMGDTQPIGDDVEVTLPYSIYETFDEVTSQQRVAVMPYEYPYLLEPMKVVMIRGFDIMWNKRLDEFPQVESQYLEATTGVKIEDKTILL